MREGGPVRTVLRLTAMELRLFLREPMTVVFVLVLPLVMLYVLDGVFGDQADPDVYEGLGASTFYAPTYVALSVATIGVVFLPVHLAGYQERGVLKRFRASALSQPVVHAGHLLMGLVVALVSAALLSVVALVGFDVAAPASVPQLALGTLVVGLSFGALGLLLGLLAPSARAAQGLGVLLFFLFLILGGPGPPLEVLPTAMVRISDWLPMTYAGQLLRELWVEGDWLARPLIVLAGMTAACLVLAALRGRAAQD